MIDLNDKGILMSIEERLIDLDRRHRSAFNVTSGLGVGDFVKRAQQLADRLAGREGYTAGTNTAEGLLALLVPQAEQQERSFWATELGGALAWWTGGKDSSARRRMIAEVVTGVSRQGVAKMIGDGHLVTSAHDGDVTAMSLLLTLQRRYPHEVTA